MLKDYLDQSSSRNGFNPRPILDVCLARGKSSEPLTRLGEHPRPSPHLRKKIVAPGKILIRSPIAATQQKTLLTQGSCPANRRPMIVYDEEDKRMLFRILGLGPRGNDVHEIMVFPTQAANNLFHWFCGPSACVCLQVLERGGKVDKRMARRYLCLDSVFIFLRFCLSIRICLFSQINLNWHISHFSHLMLIKATCDIKPL